ncbi:MarR family transcriptional regulator [Neobacillus niacini]|uniref:MarR family winged helix-turn-helix transcriptional regulator n=1 Tax=Neobacillus niacini TaxID=86668 RepID=UPI0007ABE50A|nr:MarR family transcriptional regulator [Neobacillus niacini]MEC1524587.1 MarR family transcriptional regulator [Neobacillus niacini]
MEHNNIFELIRTVELFTNESIIRWTKAFKYKIGISPILVLSVLKQNGAQKQTTLANELGYTPGAMTNIANRLISQGFAKREFNEEDRRIVLLEITEEGKNVLKEAQRVGKELRKELFQQLSEEEIEQFLAIHKKLVNTLSESK